jgi:pyrroloquinoline quinone (PQQ) biosynthesis protein C
MKSVSSGRPAAIETMVNEALDRIRSHPFVTDAARGELSRQQAERWIKCAGRESRSFPAILKNMLETVAVPGIRSVLEENLADEFGHGDPEHAHFRHYLYLLEDLQIPHAQFFDYPEGPGIRLALSTAYNVSKAKSLPIALGYMLVNEGMTPITYGAARAGLSRYFPNLNPTFFEMHVEVDAHHVAQLYDCLQHLSPSDEPDLKFGILLGERGMAALLDEAYGIFDHFPVLPAYDTGIEAAPTRA